MTAGTSRARARFASTLGMAILALVAFVTVPARAAAQQATPPKKGAVLPGMSEAQLCAMVKNAMKQQMGGGKRNAAATRRTYLKIDVATPDRALLGHTPVSRSAAKGAAGRGGTASPERALLGHTPPASATTKSAAPQRTVQFSVSTGPGQPARQITCNQ